MLKPKRHLDKKLVMNWQDYFKVPGEINGKRHGFGVIHLLFLYSHVQVQ